MESISAPNNICANCGKGEEDGDTKLKKCSACLSVKYCSRECQATHRPMHKKACKKRAAALYDEKLFKDVEREECPICFIPHPIEAKGSIFKSCCGKRICSGCVLAMMDANGGKQLCPFCRELNAFSDNDHVKRTKKLMKAGNAEAFNMLGGCYSIGEMGMPIDWVKAVELYLRAGELGSAGGYYNMGQAYRDGTGVEKDYKKAQHYYTLAAMGGDLHARHNVGALEGKAGNEYRAFKHYIIAARAGFKESLDRVKLGYMAGYVTKDDYANTLRLYHDRQKEMRSDARDKVPLSKWKVR